MAIIKGFYASWLQPKSLHERINIFRNGPPLRLQPLGEVWSLLLRGFTCVCGERKIDSLQACSASHWSCGFDRKINSTVINSHGLFFPGLLSVIVFSFCFSNDRDKPTAPPSLRRRRPIRRQTALFVSARTFDWKLPTARPTSCRPCDPTWPSPSNPLETFRLPVTAIHYRRAGNRGSGKAASATTSFLRGSCQHEGQSSGRSRPNSAFSTFSIHLRPNDSMSETPQPLRRRPPRVHCCAPFSGGALG